MSWMCLEEHFVPKGSFAWRNDVRGCESDAALYPIWRAATQYTRRAQQHVLHYEVHVDV
jgi:hypothetical protein